MRSGWHKPFLACLSETANISRSCAAAGISRQAAYMAREQDDSFRQAWDEAIADAVDLLKGKLWDWSIEGDFPDKRALAKWLVQVHDASYRDFDRQQINVNVDARQVKLEGPELIPALARAVQILTEAKALGDTPLQAVQVEALEPRAAQHQNGHAPA